MNGSNTNIQVLKQTELFGQQFEVYGTPQEPLFKAKDVALMLGLTNQREFVSRVDEDEVRKLNLLGQSGETWMLTENGLYEVLMQSRKPIAKQFKRGVKAVLKEIRTNGGYITTQEVDTPEMIMARALQVAQATIERNQKQLQQARAQIEEDRPKVVFANALQGSNSSCLIGECAKILRQNGVEMGERRFFEYLRANGYLCTKGERRNLPTQEAIERGLFEIKKGVRSGSGGVLHETKTPKITAKGQAYFINKFLAQ